MGNTRSLTSGTNLLKCNLDLGIIYKMTKQEKDDLERTIFDYSITESELRTLEINDSKEEYLKSYSKLNKLYDVYRLMKIRGEKENAQRILRFIQHNIDFLDRD